MGGGCTGIYFQCLNMLQEQNHGFVVLCYVYCKHSKWICFSPAECCIPSHVMRALFFMCCVQRRNMNVMLCIWIWVFKKCWLLLSSQLLGLTSYLVTLRTATYFNHIIHHQAINCCKNIDLEIQKGLSLLTVFTMWLRSELCEYYNLCFCNRWWPDDDWHGWNMLPFLMWLCN
jgi:hypothetical protein